MKINKNNKLNLNSTILSLLLLHSGNVLSDDDMTEDAHEQGVMFTDIATNPNSGLVYQRTRSLRDSILDQYKEPGSILNFTDIPFTPGNSRGNPGVAIFDYDGDDDLDIYVTNGPGTENSLFSNMQQESGELYFIDVGEQAGVGAAMQDSAAVCFADIDNDGDKDLYVTGTSEANKLFENKGNGSFKDITDISNTAGSDRNSVGCSFGDINGDGLVDLVVANLYESFENRLALMVPGFEHLKEHNKLFINKGNNHFEDVSQSSGIEEFLGASWAIAMVDYDKDGDVDIVIADDQGTRIPAKVGGEDFGYVRILNNDGTGHFTDVTEMSGTNIVGDWMGLSFGDLNSDGNIDIFVSNIGDYLAASVGASVGLPTGPNEWSSRWFLGQDDFTFTDPGIGQLGTTPFGWGTSMADYDNDGDTDIIFHGGADMGALVDATNPGSVLQNDGDGLFSYDKNALALSSNHTRRNVHGMAIGDLDKNGFIDIVSVSSMDWPEPLPVFPIVDPSLMFGGQFDETALIWPTFRPAGTDPSSGFVWNGWNVENGSLSVEVNHGENENNSTSITLLGVKGILKNGKVNRDGIGAVITFSYSNTSTTIPVVSGGSHASSDSLQKTFGMGESEEGVLDVLWPGGTRNRLYEVTSGEHILFPEIPCSYDDDSVSFKQYRKCVRKSIKQLYKKKLINEDQKENFIKSAIKAFKQVNSL